MSVPHSRRTFTRLLSQLGVVAYVAPAARSLFADDITEDRLRPNVSCGVASGDLSTNSATIWSRSDRSSRMLIDVSSNVLDNTFGPQLKFKAIPDGMRPNRPPSEGFQFFGLVKIDSQSKAMTVTHYSTSGKNLWSIELPASSKPELF